MLKVTKSKLFYTSLFITTLAGCGSPSSDSTARTELSSEAKAKRDMERQKIIESYEAKLAELELKIEDGKKKAANATAEARAKFEEQLVELNKKVATAKSTLSELKSSASDAASDTWEKVKSTLDTTWDNIHDAGSRFLDWF